jgi:hypothetical protein
MSETIATTERIPANIMGLLRQSYDSREKILDWVLAIGVTLALVYAFRDELQSLVGSPDQAGPNTGRSPEPQPNQNIAGAFPNAGTEGGRWPGLYAYNMPSSRDIRYTVGPSATAPPVNPSNPPEYPTGAA